MTFFRREGENPMKHFGSYLTIAGAVPNGMIQGVQLSVPLGLLNDPLVQTIMFQIIVVDKDPKCIIEADLCHNAEIFKMDHDT